MSDPFFHRPNLAKKMSVQILSDAIGAPGRSGIFLSAPRRTGKSTFIREDLMPELRGSGAIVIYVDLWENRQGDPGGEIIMAIRAELSDREGVLSSIMRSAGVDKVSVGGVSFSVDRIGLGLDVSPTKALVALSDQVRAPIVLIIDEAQHAITSELGNNMLFALKAARDELNSSAHFGLRIVATGSNRDKLATLKNGKDQAFYGAAMTSFPPLGREFVNWFCSGITDLSAPLDGDVVMRCFEKASFRPEVLNEAVCSLRLDLFGGRGDINAEFENEVDRVIRSLSDQTAALISSLTPLQSAVLRVMATAKSGEYAPFESVTLKKYGGFTQGVMPDVSGVQGALQALQDKGLVWKESRGIYALEDPSIAEFLNTTDHGRH